MPLVFVLPPTFSTLVAPSPPTVTVDHHQPEKTPAATAARPTQADASTSPACRAARKREEATTVTSKAGTAFATFACNSYAFKSNPVDALNTVGSSWMRTPGAPALSTASSRRCVSSAVDSSGVTVSFLGHDHHLRSDSPVPCFREETTTTGGEQLAGSITS